MPTVSFNTHFPGYDVLGEIGRSNARVLKARHIASGDLVAIKHFALNTDADTLRRFERESEIMTKITHPNIVRVREVRLEADLPYIVLDYIEGGSVRQLLKEQGCLSVEMTIRLGLQMVNAFRLIHAEGIVHRDVKPENILYHRLASGELHFLLTDFGVARLHEQPVTLTGQSLMTYEYAAPEQFDNPRNLIESADYYALGVVLYECLTGKVPFAMRGETGIITFMNAVLKTPPAPPVLPSNQPVPGSLAQLVKQLLIKDPAARIHNPDAVKLALKQADVEQLHHEHGQNGPVEPPEITRTAAYHPAAPPKDSADDDSFFDNTPAKIRPRRGTMLAASLAGVLLVLGSCGYWFFAKTALQFPAASPTSETTATLQPPTDAATVPKAAQAAEEARLRAETARRHYQETVAAATNRLDAQTFGGKSGFFGGIKGLNVQVRNPSSVTFKQVAVRVQYIKEGGDLFKSTIMYFNDIGPNATVVRQAPNSPRGSKFRASVVRADAAPPDSLASPMPLNP